jgi:hypothetical protein
MTRKERMIFARFREAVAGPMRVALFAVFGIAGAGQGAEILRVISWSRDAGEQNTLQMNVPPQYSPTLRWLADLKAAFTAGDAADRFPEVPFEQHQKILDVLTRARYLRLLWFPRLRKP